MGRVFYSSHFIFRTHIPLFPELISQTMGSLTCVELLPIYLSHAQEMSASFRLNILTFKIRRSANALKAIFAGGFLTAVKVRVKVMDRDEPHSQSTSHGQ